jgi:hypothetical protein
MEDLKALGGPFFQILLQKELFFSSFQKLLAHWTGPLGSSIESFNVFHVSIWNVHF